MADFATWVEKNRGLWARVYDEVIAPDFEKEWQKREEEHEIELKQRDENQQLLFNHINEQIVKNARFVEENERLETELHQRAESTAPSTTFEVAGTISTSVPEGQHRGLTEKYDELSKKYQDLSQKIKYLERKNNAVMQKNRDMKDSVRAWQQYADRQKSHQKFKGGVRADEGPSRLSAVPQNDEVSPHMPSSPTSVSTVRTPLLRAGRGRSPPAPGVPPANIEASYEAEPHEDREHSPSASFTPKGPTALSGRELQDAAHGGSHLDTRLDRSRRMHAETNKVPSSSQTTVDEGAYQVNRGAQAVDIEDEDDTLEIVSERSLKRKRDQTSRVDVFTGRSSDGTPAKPHRVKDEPLSSSPPAMHALLRTETIDLDDPAIDLDDSAQTDFEAPHPFQRTPSIYSKATGSSRHQRSGSAPCSQVANRETVRGEHRGSDRASNVQARLQIAAAEMRALSEPMDPHSDDQHILQHLEPNIVAQTPVHSPNKRFKQAEAQRIGYGMLVESGEALPPVDENELRLPPSAARARLNQRMRATKNPQTPANRLQRSPTLGSPLVKQEQMATPPDSTSRSARTTSGGSRKSASSARLNQHENIVPDDRPVWSMRALDRRLGTPKSNTSPSDRQPGLRTRPVKELKVHDFRPNPVYNQGYSYAFSEAVRKRGDRMCLPGCTNPQCCGSHFRRLAEALEPLPVPQEEALLEDYLGDAYDTIMSTQMSSDERAELILQARTKKMAKDTGKHREAYERRRTPPGFWRVDFPTTQELEVDRGQAKEQEIKTVQERWLEAQKKGGRWIFRDE